MYSLVMHKWDPMEVEHGRGKSARGVVGQLMWRERILSVRMRRDEEEYFMRNATQLSRKKVKIKFCKGFPPYLESDALSRSNGMIVEWGV